MNTAPLGKLIEEYKTRLAKADAEVEEYRKFYGDPHYDHPDRKITREMIRMLEAVKESLDEVR